MESILLFAIFCNECLASASLVRDNTAIYGRVNLATGFGLITDQASNPSPHEMLLFIAIAHN